MHIRTVRITDAAAGLRPGHSVAVANHVGVSLAVAGSGPPAGPGPRPATLTVAADSRPCEIVSNDSGSQALGGKPTDVLASTVVPGRPTWTHQHRGATPCKPADLTTPPRSAWRCASPQTCPGPAPGSRCRCTLSLSSSPSSFFTLNHFSLFHSPAGGPAVILFGWSSFQYHYMF